MHDTLMRRAATAAVCHGCRTRVPAARPLWDRLSQSRSFSSPASAPAADPAAAPPSPPPAAGFTALSSRQLLSLSGPDAAKFLQGLITSNVLAKDGVPRADPFYTAFLNATGRVLHDVFVYPYQKGPGLPDGTSSDRAYLLEMDAGQSATLRSYLRRYKLRSKIALQPLTSDDATVWQMWDDAVPTDPSSDAPSTLTSNDSRIVFRDPRAPGLGHRLIYFNNSNGGAPPPELDGSMEQSTEDAYTIRRYLRGVPEGQGEILREQALPQESNMDVMRAIDWHKGCYVGQELTIRTRHRGVVRKRVLPCVIYGVDEPAPAALTYDPRSSKGGAAAAGLVPTETSIERHGKTGRSRSRPVGKWLRGVGNIGLALCRLETMTDVTLPGEQASQSFTADSEFDMEWGAEGDGPSTVKVKAFVPDWHRIALSQG
jgi:folate-binding protein YgfZ